MTLYNWLIAYLTNDQSLRMIFYSGTPESKPDPVKENKTTSVKSGENKMVSIT